MQQARFSDMMIIWRNERGAGMPTNGPRILLARGLRLRCPVCGKGKIFQGLVQTYERCPVCHFVYEREPGYYTGAMAVNLIVTELLLVAVALPVAASQAVSIPVMIVLGLTLPVVLPLIFYRPSKSLWMSLDHLLHPIEEPPPAE
jgi:uncharacterized protein (DUF983 family)